MNARARVVVGDPAAETRATQVLALALSGAAEHSSPRVGEAARNVPIPPLLLAASKCLTLASLEAPHPPLEVLALATRNTFELYLRLKHILMSDANCQGWRDEAAGDHIQIYEGILGIDGPESAKATIAAEIDEIRRDAAARGLKPTTDFLLPGRLARAVGLENEHHAFYKFYSKFVHPSSFWVNRPTAASTPAFRAILMFNLQLYGHLLLDEVEVVFGIPPTLLLQDAQRTLDSH